ncbi:MAG: hypothetical protein HY591_02365 [Candidatus Omnitrophica bacterium]|nr:hypothetical protein [Candidatus Omnitrophota bacterium]
MKTILLVILVLTVTGCTSTEAIRRNYDTLVDVFNGVDEQEAKIIAQKEIIGMQQSRDYRVTAPDIKTTQAALQYTQYWFVAFGHNWFSPISTDPMAKTYTQLRETQYLVVIDKKTGNIKFSGEWYLKRANDFNWVFDPNAYKAADPLALPPGEKGQPLF